MKKVIKKIIEVKKDGYVDIIGASLLTLDQFEKARKVLPHCKREWWIMYNGKSPGEGKPLVVSRDLVTKDYDVTELLGVRPVLYLYSHDLKISDKFEFAGHILKVILEDDKHFSIAITKDVIGLSCFNENEENNPNDYNNSEIKYYIDNWAEENGITGINDID